MVVVPLAFNVKHMKNEPKKAILDKYFSGNESVRPGQMFGYPAYYVGRTMFACLYEGNMGLKIPEEEADKARLKEKITDFRPKGRPKMREWIQFSLHTEKELALHEDLIDIALQYAKARTTGK